MSYSVAMAGECSPDSGLWTVLLAAGASRRLGEPKQLLRLRGKPLLLHAVERAAQVTPGKIVIVLGAHACRLRSTLRLAQRRPHVVHNAHWPSGMASSLRRGLRALPPKARAALLLLTDQPRVDARALKRLADAWRAQPQRPVAAFYCGRAGTPAILPRRMFTAARRLEGDVGARKILRSSSAVIYVDLPQAATDIDTPSDRAGL